MGILFFNALRNLREYKNSELNANMSQWVLIHPLIICVEDNKQEICKSTSHARPIVRLYNF